MISGTTMMMTALTHPLQVVLIGVVLSRLIGDGLRAIRTAWGQLAQPALEATGAEGLSSR